MTTFEMGKPSALKQAKAIKATVAKHRKSKTPVEAAEYLMRFFEGFEESGLWQEYLQSMADLDHMSKSDVEWNYD